jgi:biopolymer transport protein ExbD
MKVRKSGAGSGKIEQQMTPMIDVVFQLLIFFMLTLKIIEPEGDFNINLPIAAPAAQEVDFRPPEIRVRLRSAADGSLASLELGNRNLLAEGDPARAFQRLNGEILTLIGVPGQRLAQEMEVEIDADYNLHYEHVISCVGACTGRIDPKTKSIVRYIEKIKFAPPRPSQI